MPLLLLQPLLSIPHQTANLSPAAGGRLSAEQTLLQTKRPAPQVLATEQRIAIAKKLLLTPFGLTESHLAKALNEIRAHKVDDADLYFQYTRSEGWSLEEGIVKTGSFSIDQGVGVRAVSGEKTAFAYSDDISEASLLDAARTVRSISAAAKSGRVKNAARKIATQPLALPRPGPDCHAGQHRQGRIAGKGRKARQGQRPAHRAGHGRSGQRIRRGDGGARRRHAGR